MNVAATVTEKHVKTLKVLFSFSRTVLLSFLGRLPKVDLIILEGENVRTSVRPQKVYSISMKFGK